MCINEEDGIVVMCAAIYGRDTADEGGVGWGGAGSCWDAGGDVEGVDVGAGEGGSVAGGAGWSWGGVVGGR